MPNPIPTFPPSIIKIDCGESGFQLSPSTCSCPYPYTGSSDEIRSSPTCAINLHIIRFGYLFCVLSQALLLFPVSCYHVYCVYNRRERHSALVAQTQQQHQQQLITNNNKSHTVGRKQDLSFAIHGLILSIVIMITFTIRSIYPDRVLGTDGLVTITSSIAYSVQILFVAKWLNRLRSYTVHPSIIKRDVILATFIPFMTVMYTLPIIIGGPIFWIVEYAVHDDPGPVFEQLAFSVFRGFLIVGIVLLASAVLCHRLYLLLLSSPQRKNLVHTINTMLFFRNLIVIVVVVVSIGCLIILSSEFMQVRVSYLYLYLVATWTPQQFFIVKLGIRESEVRTSPSGLIRWLLVLGNSSGSNSGSNDNRNQGINDGNKTDVGMNRTRISISQQQLQQQQEEDYYNDDNVIRNKYKMDKNSDDDDNEDENNGIYAPFRHVGTNTDHGSIVESHSSIPESAVNATVIEKVDDLVET
jgi:hypothetical protein